MAAVLENVHSISGVTVAAMDLVSGGRSPLIVTGTTTVGANAIRDAVEHVGFGVPSPRPRAAPTGVLAQPGAIPDNIRDPATDPVVEVRRDQEKEHDMSENSPKVIDPVCGMNVDPATAAATVEHEGRMYYFCGKGCAKSFSADPGKYAKATVS